jgi:hypothetical protein
MKKLFLPLFASVLFISTSSFKVTGAYTDINTSLIQQQDFQNLDPFSVIHIGVRADVYYSVDSKYGLSVEGDERDIEDLEIEVKNGSLSIRYENQRMKRSKLTIHVSSKELEGVKISGSASFQAKDIKSEEVDLVVSGSGNIDFNSLETEEASVRISGSGDVSIVKGSAEECDISISGSGKFHAEGFSIEEVSAKISGSGGCKITATGELDAAISGSGSIYYHGSPQINSRVSGSGKVKEL